MTRDVVKSYPIRQGIRIIILLRYLLEIWRAYQVFFEQVVGERDASDNITKQYVHGAGIDDIIRVDRDENGTMVPYYFLKNGIGSITAVTDDSGDLVERVSYDTYGMPTITDTSGTVLTNSSIGNDFLFHGRRYDKETNLYYYRARYLDPIMGSFLQTDPMGYRDSMNLYQAFNQNPVNYIDPFGLLTAEFVHLGEYAEDPSRVDGSKKIKEFPYGDMYKYFTNYKSHIGILDNRKASFLNYKIVSKDNKYYARFDMKMSIYIFFKWDESSNSVQIHERKHIPPYKLMYLESLFELNKFESEGYLNLDELKAEADLLVSKVHPTKRKYDPSWWPTQPFENQVAAFFDNWLPAQFREHDQDTNDFFDKIDPNIIKYFMQNIEKVLSEFGDFNIEDFRR